jgi:hypothetical protein
VSMAYSGMIAVYPHELENIRIIVILYSSLYVFLPRYKYAQKHKV